jgi:hypothetical protein
MSTLKPLGLTTLFKFIALIETRFVWTHLMISQSIAASWWPASRLTVTFQDSWCPLRRIMRMALASRQIDSMAMERPDPVCLRFSLYQGANLPVLSGAS